MVTGMARRQTRLVVETEIFFVSSCSISVGSLLTSCDDSRNKCRIPRTFSDPALPEKKRSFSICPDILSPVKLLSFTVRINNKRGVARLWKSPKNRTLVYNIVQQMKTGPWPDQPDRVIRLCNNISNFCS